MDSAMDLLKEITSNQNTLIYIGGIGVAILGGIGIAVVYYGQSKLSNFLSSKSMIMHYFRFNSGK